MAKEKLNLATLVDWLHASWLEPLVTQAVENSQGIFFLGKPGAGIAEIIKRLQAVKSGKNKKAPVYSLSLPLVPRTEKEILALAKRRVAFFICYEGEEKQLLQARKKKQLSPKIFTFLKMHLREVPSLESQKDLLPLLIQRALNLDNTNPLRIDEYAMQRLLNYSWPGELEELLFVLNEAMRDCKNNVISVDELTLPVPMASGEELYPQQLPPELRS